MRLIIIRLMQSSNIMGVPLACFALFPYDALALGSNAFLTG